MSERFNVLLSSAGRRVALLEIFRRTLGELGLTGKVFAADASRLSSAFHSADRGFLVPRCDSPEFVPAILDICASTGVRLVVPTIDPELPVYARHRDRFAEAGVTVAISSPEVVRLCEDKQLTHSWLSSNGFPTVPQTTAEEIMATPNCWPFPTIVKPRKGSASIGVAVVHDRTELLMATGGAEFVVQTIAPGIEFTVDILADRTGRCLCAVPRKRIEVRSGESSKGVTARSDAIEAVAHRVCERLPGAYGPLTAQVFLDPSSGELNVIELNARFGGGYPLSWEAGARHPLWLIEEIIGRPSTADAGVWRDGVVMLRYDEAVFIHPGGAGL